MGCVGAEANRPRRPTWRFLVIVVVALAIAGGIVALHAFVRKREVQQDSLLGYLHRHGARSYYEPRGPLWLLEFVPREFGSFRRLVIVIESPGVDRPTLQRLVAVGLADHVITLFLAPGEGDATIEELARFGRLRVLNLARTGVTDAGLARVSKIAALEALNLSHTAITDAGLKHVGKLRYLQKLDVSGTRVTARGLPSLDPCTQMAEVSMFWTAITDAEATAWHTARPAISIVR